MDFADIVRQGIRTLAQALAGVLMAWLVQNGADIDESSVVLVIGAVLTAGYAVAVSLLSRRWPALGWLNVINRSPRYSHPPVEGR